MIYKGYINEIKKYEKINLGSTELMFLDAFSYKNESASGILHMLADSGKAMAYKNVHKTVKRLEELGLIKNDSMDPKHNAIIYKITARGIFQIMLDGHLFFIDWLIANHNDILLQTLLFQFFSDETIRKFNTIARLKVLGDYLRKCCDISLTTISAFKSFKNYHGKYQNLEYVIEELITNEVRNFIFQIIAMKKLPFRDFGLVHSNYNLPWFSEVGYEKELIDKGDPDYSEQFPKATLMKDKKFMKLLREIKEDFDKGCKDYLISPTFFH